MGDSAKGYNGLALCDIRNGDYDSALDNITKGLPTATTDEMQSLLFNEIVAYEKKLDFATALTKAQEYVDMFPEDSAAKKRAGFPENQNVFGGLIWNILRKYRTGLS